jgi:predicted RND superfamily exporter protein
MVPILVTIALLAASMRYLGVQFNAITGTVLSIGIGLGIDYSAHLVHRISEEYRQAADLFDALTVSVVGTGGALTGSMITTTSGTGVLVVALVPVLGQFGLLIALSVLYSYLTTLLILPSAVVMWDNGWGVFDPRRLMSSSNT